MQLCAGGRQAGDGRVAPFQPHRPGGKQRQPVSQPRQRQACHRGHAAGQQADGGQQGLHRCKGVHNDGCPTVCGLPCRGCREVGLLNCDIQQRRQLSSQPLPKLLLLLGRLRLLRLLLLVLLPWQELARILLVSIQRRGGAAADAAGGWRRRCCRPRCQQP